MTLQKEEGKKSGVKKRTHDFAARGFLCLLSATSHSCSIGRTGIFWECHCS